jgi:serine phosphatase RsbU (regulator of sigma subunit)
MMNTTQTMRQGYIPLKYQIMGAILLFVIPVLILLSVSNYLSTRASLRASDALLQTQTEASITNALKLVDTAYKMFEQPLDPILREAFVPFFAAYEASGGRPELIDLAAVQAQAEAMTGLELDVYIINADSVISYTTDTGQVGLDFKKLIPDLVEPLRAIRLGDTFVADRMTAHLNTGEFHKWVYYPTPDHRYILEYGVIIRSLERFAGDLDPLKLTAALKQLNPAVDEIRMYDYKGRLISSDQTIEVDEATHSMLLEVLAGQRPEVEVADAATGTFTRYFLVDLRDERYPSDTRRVVGVTYNSRLIDQALARQTRSNLLISLAAVALTVMITYLLSGWLSRPILQLNQAAKKLARGEWLQSVPVRSRNEVGELARSFEGMAGQLHELVENLEHKVAERTGELAEANASITQLNEQLKSENLRMGAELDVTRRLQRMILPTQEELQAVEGLEIAAYMEPAAEVGGDYYDVLRLNGHVKIGIGDVTDHGLESGVVMLMAQTAVRTLLTSGETNPERFLDVLNRTVYGNVQRMQTNRNLSLSIIDYEHGQVRLSGQHEELLLVRKDGCIERVDTGDLGFPIGLYDEATEFFHHTTLDLAPGDGFVLYTDGIPEAENQAGEQYGLERLCQTISRCWSQTSERIKETVIHDVRQFIGGHTVFDDITLLVVKQR